MGFAQRERPAQQNASLHNGTSRRIALALICIIVVFMVLENKSTAASVRVSIDENLITECRNMDGRSFQNVVISRRSPHVGSQYTHAHLLDNLGWNSNPSSGSCSWSKCPLLKIIGFIKGKIIGNFALPRLQRNENTHIFCWRISRILKEDRDIPVHYLFRDFVQNANAVGNISKNKCPLGILNQSFLAGHQFGLIVERFCLIVHQFGLSSGELPQQASEDRNKYGRNGIQPFYCDPFVVAAITFIVSFGGCFGLFFFAGRLWLIGDRKLSAGSRCGGWVLISIANTIGIGSPLAILGGLIWWGNRWLR